MSDFLDRLALRAIGGDGVLAPRLPSLFEPAAAAPTVAPVASGNDGAVGVSLAPLRGETASSPSVHEAELPSPEQTAPKSPPIATTAPHAEKHPSPPTARVTEPGAPAKRSRHHDEPGPADQRPRRISGAPPPQAMQSPLVHAEPRHPIDRPPSRPLRGALLAPASPVFAAPRSATHADAPDTRAGNARLRTARASAPAHGTSEPVVHVSIGRLEVRATPTAASSPRHRDEPRPASLDDYLRQRGKAP